MTPEDLEDRVSAAGEYVLGTLDSAARREFEARMESDLALRAEVYRWQDRLLPLTDRIPVADPDPGQWREIETRLSPVAPRAHAANDALWRRLRRWQLTAGLSMAAAVLMATLLALQSSAPPSVRYLTLLKAPSSEQIGWIVEATVGAQIRLVALDPSADALPPGKALQFWTKPEGAAGPTSLGLVSPGANTGLPATLSPGIGEHQLFELTLEPETGSPTGKPTGPILFVGRSMRL
ncbi:MAG: RNA polymerase subunit sigma-70 [Variovorax sp.]|nr:MAG: RNA polymerase subunit sigma-70 [Variovorax sp.]